MKPKLRKNGLMMADVRVPMTICHKHLIAAVMEDIDEGLPETRAELFSQTREYLQNWGICHADGDHWSHCSDEQFRHAKACVMALAPEFWNYGTNEKKEREDV